MTSAQADAIERHGVRFLVDPKSEFTPRELFSEANQSLDPIIVEIGSGMGEATAQIAERFPESGFVAVEVHKPGIGALILRADQLQLTNLKVINEDCHMVLDLIKNESIDGIHIFFPDPWPKKRHQKRRLINSKFASVLEKKVKPQGLIRIATDWIEYADRIAEVFSQSSSFSGGVCARPDWRPLTKFEGQGLDKDHHVTDFLFIKN
jgi:tRNA (guanine-N7-)-methyltransferase